VLPHPALCKFENFNTPVKVKPFESPGNAGGLPILILSERAIMSETLDKPVKEAHGGKTAAASPRLPAQ
jgi:hypothetical protein